SSRRRHTRSKRDWSSDVCSSDLVVYQALTLSGEEVTVRNPSELPPANEMEEVREPIILASILTPQEYVGAIMQLCMEKRGVQKKIGRASCREGVWIGGAAVRGQR